MTTSAKEATSRVQNVVRVRQANPEAANTPGMTGEDIKAMLNDQLNSAYQEHLMTPQPPSQEIAEPLFWWDVYALGPIQPGAQLTPPGSFSGPLLPHQIIRAGERAYVAAILLLNTNFPSSTLSAAELLSNFGLPYRIEYNTGELKKWQLAPAYLQHVGNGSLTPGVPWAIDVFDFIPQDEGLYEMNVSARIFGCDGITAPPFSAYASVVVDIDSDMFNTHPRVEVDTPMRFQVYR
jgi:hypothetical protein